MHRRIISEILKPCIYTQDAGAIIAQIRRLIRKIKFTVEFQLIKGHPKNSPTFEQRPLEYLIRECNQAAKEARMQVYRRINDMNIKYVGYYAIKINGSIMTNSIKETIRIVDTK